MKIKINVLTVLVVALSLTSVALAAPQATQGHTPTKHHGKWKSGFAVLAKKLNLTAVQEKDFKAVMLHSRKEIHAIFMDKALTKQERRAKMIAIHRQSHMEIMKILTPTQRKEYIAIMKERRAKMMARKHQNKNQKP